MKHWLALLGAIVAAAILSGCAATPVDATLRTKLRRVGVASVTQDVIHHRHQGLTVFQNREWDASVPEWKIDETGEQLVAARLRTSGVQAQPASRSALFQTPTPYAGWNPNDKAIAGKVQALCARENLDAVAVIYPSFFDVEYSFGPYRGVGFYTANATFLKSSGVYAVLKVVVYDRQGAKIGSGFSGNTPLLAPAEIPRHDDWAGYLPAEREALRKKIVEVMDLNLTKQVKDLGF